MSKNFQRTKEDFTCEQCQTHVIGNGYTNHCSQCLWSKHVDVNPGDRQSPCKGMMKPHALEFKAGRRVICHQCLKCGMIKKNRMSPKDNFEILFKYLSFQ